MPKVIFLDTGESGEIAAGACLKDVIKEKGWPVAFGCEDGVCGTCIVKVEEGMKNLSPAGERENQTLDMMGMKDGAHRLACQCFVNGDCKIRGM